MTVEIEAKGTQGFKEYEASSKTNAKVQIKTEQFKIET
jgi:hypothetical protein